MDVYWDAMMEEPVELPEFMERVGSGRYGSFSADEIAEFLRECERDILGNIETKAGAMPNLDEFVEERITETRRMIADLMKRYAGR